MLECDRPRLCERERDLDLLRFATSTLRAAMSARSFSTSVGTQAEAGLSATALIDGETTEGELMSKMLSASLACSSRESDEAVASTIRTLAGNRCKNSSVKIDLSILASPCRCCR